MMIIKMKSFWWKIWTENIPFLSLLECNFPSFIIPHFSSFHFIPFHYSVSYQQHHEGWIFPSVHMQMAAESNEREKWQIRLDALSLNASSVLQYSNHFLCTAPFLYFSHSRLHADMWQEHLLFQLLYFREMIWIWNDFKISSMLFPIFV